MKGRDVGGGGWLRVGLLSKPVKRAGKFVARKTVNVSISSTVWTLLKL